MKILTSLYSWGATPVTVLVKPGTLTSPVYCSKIKITPATIILLWACGLLCFPTRGKHKKHTAVRALNCTAHWITRGFYIIPIMVTEGGLLLVYNYYVLDSLLHLPSCMENCRTKEHFKTCLPPSSKAIHLSTKYGNY